MYFLKYTYNYRDTGSGKFPYYFRGEKLHRALNIVRTDDAIEETNLHEFVSFLDVLQTEVS